MGDSADDRIARLEERFAFLERDLEQMSEVVRELGDQSHAMRRELGMMRADMRRMSDVPAPHDAAAGHADSPSQPEPTPPHWGRRPADD